MTERQIEEGKVLAAKKVVEERRLSELTYCYEHLKKGGGELYSIDVCAFFNLWMEVSKDALMMIVSQNIDRSRQKIETLNKQIELL